MWLNYHHLQYFQTVAQEGSFSKAAKRLRLSQPTLSAQIKNLEDRLQKKLFERKGKILLLTETGRMTLVYANEIFRLGTEFLDTIQDRSTEGLHRVQVGITPGIPKAVLLDLINYLNQKSLHTVSITENNLELLVEQLVDSKIDLIISKSSPSSFSPDSKIQTRLLAESDVIVCGGAGTKKLQLQFPKSLQGEKFILPSPHDPIRSQFSHFIDTQRIEIQIVAETQDTATQKLYTSTGKALTVLSRKAAEEMLHQKKLTLIGTLPKASDRIWASVLQRTVRNPAATLVMEKFSL
jgi:LysR family transcriptional activator of nhaA